MLTATRYVSRLLLNVYLMLTSFKEVLDSNERFVTDFEDENLANDLKDVDIIISWVDDVANGEAVTLCDLISAYWARSSTAALGNIQSLKGCSALLPMVRSGQRLVEKLESAMDIAAAFHERVDSASDAEKMWATKWIKSDTLNPQFIEITECDGNCLACCAKRLDRIVKEGRLALEECAAATNACIRQLRRYTTKTSIGNENRHSGFKRKRSKALHPDHSKRARSSASANCPAVR